jgi:hypothetical protein
VVREGRSKDRERAALDLRPGAGCGVSINRHCLYSIGISMAKSKETEIHRITHHSAPSTQHPAGCRGCWLSSTGCWELGLLAAFAFAYI